jgi:predicted nucleic acid-binding protein
VLSVDTNILFHAFNRNSRDHANAYAWLDSVRNRDDVAISELILAELYRLLRNPVVLTRPLNPEEAVEVV